ncbi:MAG: DUF1501 domain-containing protein [Ancalomicrobiaceae bacterium]|nr:DUF1501 domain-containing protein [Ancalomicrobiaceae bacterium]
MRPHVVSRRGLLLTGGALVAWGYLPNAAMAAAGRDPRFVFINLRGALDGLAAVAPVGDPDYERVRSGLVLPTSGANPAYKLNDFFVLHPAMKTFADLYSKGEALVVHAVASPYRERSHFDGQDVLEAGLGGVGKSATGWLNRATALIPKGERIDPVEGLSVGAAVPLVMRGPAPVVTWLPQGFPPATDDTRNRLAEIYAHVDPELARRFDEALKVEHAAMADPTAKPGAKRPDAGSFREAGLAAGRLLARADGPRLGSMSFLGWDTHADEKPLDGQLNRLLGALDAAIDGLRSELAGAWKDTVVVVATEFGRTARMNGTLGTDHGTATIALLVGGAVKGGRVIADWPGLTDAKLYQNRDLAPTNDVRAVFKGILRDHIGLDEKLLASEVFPASAQIKPLGGLVA